MSASSFFPKFCLTIVVGLSLLLSLPATAQSNSAPTRRIVVIATGGTIAGTAATATQAAYEPGKIGVEALLAAVPQIQEIAQVRGLQLCNIASQAMDHATWLLLARTIDSLFIHNRCDGVVITHGTDTMEETAYFLNLCIGHKVPVVLTGAMRPATALGADGPMNLYNAVALAATPEAAGKGVMVLMNDYILSADDVTKTHSVNTAAFTCPNYGPLGYMRDGKPFFYRASPCRHTYMSEFNIKTIKSLPQVEVIYSYVNASTAPLKAILKDGAKGVVVAGVGHGNYSPAIAELLKQAADRGVAVVRSTRILMGGVTNGLEDPYVGLLSSGLKSPQKARILLMLALSKTSDTKELERIMREY